MRRYIPFANRVAGIVVLGTLLLVGLFLVTKAHWYDLLKDTEKIGFWNEAFVAYGTLALAVVTWASVSETQQVIANEDLRFRRERMPLLKVMDYTEKEDYLEVGLGNEGEGPARNVELVLTYHFRQTWEPTAGQEKYTERFARAKNLFVSSYVKQGTRAVARIGWQGQLEAFQAMRYTELRAIEVAVITYDDVFGDAYITEYDIAEDKPFRPDRFLWKPPTYLIPEKTV